MKPTRRWYTTAGLGLALAGWAALLAAPIPLLGAAGIAGLLLAAQLRFALALARTDVAAEITPATLRATADETVPVAVTVTGATDGAFSLDVTPRLPPSAEGDPSPFTVDADATTSETTVDLAVPIAGTITVPAPDVVATDRLGLYEQPVAVEAGAEITVHPRAPRNVHVGEGGETLAAAFGEHDAGRLGTGLEPAEVRRYVPGEAVRRMDWKATARRGEPHVREFEAETDRVTAVVFDVRSDMGHGRPGETKLDYAREVALAFADSARSMSDPLGCYTVGDEGLTATYEPSASRDRQQAVRDHLSAVEATRAVDRPEPETFDPATAHRRANRLGDDAFGEHLRPFLTDRSAYVERVDERPLFRAVRSLTTRQQGTLWTVILTDDTHRTELREAVRLARAGTGRVLVFLTPSVLFEPGGLTDLESAYDRYRDFEEFRRRLAGTQRVEAFEVAPGERLAAVLGAGRRERAVGGRS